VFWYTLIRLTSRYDGVVRARRIGGLTRDVCRFGVWLQALSPATRVQNPRDPRAKNPRNPRL